MDMSGQHHAPAAVHPRKNFGGWMGPIASLDSFKKVKKSLALTEIRIPDRPALSQFTVPTAVNCSMNVSNI